MKPALTTKKSNRNRLVFACLISLGCSPLYAQEFDVFSLDLADLLKVKILTATKGEETSASAPSIVTLFTRQQIEAFNANTLIDVIKHAPSIETSMSPTGQWRLSIRGERKEGNILLLLDGLPLNNLYDGAALFDMPTHIIQQIEILRGPGSALYGTNAVAGVINIITRKDANEINFSVGNYGHVAIQGSLSGQVKQAKWSLMYGLSDQDSEDLVDFYLEKNTNNVISDRTNRHIKQRYLMSSLAYDNLQINAHYLDRERGPWIGPVVDFGRNTQIEQSIWGVDLHYNWSLGEKAMLMPRFYYVNQSLDALNEDIVAGTTVLNNIFDESGFTRENYSISGFGADVELEYRASSSVRSLTGISLQRQKMDDYELLRNYQVIGFIPQSTFDNHDDLTLGQRHQERRITAAYTQAEFDFEAWDLTFGLRYDDYNDFGNSFNPRIAAVYNVSDSLRFKALFGGAFRAPTLRELYDNTRIGADGIIGNEDLAPEESNTLEVGIELVYSDWILRGDIFKRMSENVIDEFDRQGSGARGSIQNLGEIETLGGSFELIYRINDQLKLEINASRFKSEFDYNNDPQFEREILHLQTDGQRELFNQPRTRVNAKLDWQYNQWHAYISANYGGRLSHNNTTQLESLRELLVHEYTQWNLGISYVLSEQLKFNFSGNNLFEKKFSDPTGGSNSDALGPDGMIQPYKDLMLTVNYEFN